VLTPPLRPKKHQGKLWDGLKHDQLQVVSTDHCPFCFADQKTLGKDDFSKIPNGGPGIENRMQLIYHYGVNSGNFAEPVRGDGFHSASANLRPVSQEGRDCAGERTGRGDLGPPLRPHDQRQDASHARGLLYVRGFEVRGNARTVLSRGENDCGRR